MNKITKTIISVFVIILVLGLAFYPKIKKSLSKDEKEGSKKEKEKGKGGKGGKTAVVVSVVKSTRLDDMITSTGSILPNEEVEIHSEIAGRIILLNIREGENVQKETVLFKINDDDLQARLKKLGFNKKLAEDNEARQKVLLQKEAISQREYDIAVNSVNTISADMEDLKAQILKTTVRAPFSGTIGFRYVSMGSYISPSTKMATLTNTNPAKIEFSIPAKYASAIKKGNTIEFETENEGKIFLGKVYAIDPKIDAQTRTLQIRALSPNPGNKLVAGAYAKVNLILKSKGSAILIPTEAVIPESKGSKVFIVKNGKSVPVKVELGTRGERTVEILSGLKLGDTLITNGIIQVKPDGDVEIKEVVQ
jgi:membrane fusion protein (multidrug efflux system)